MSRIAKYPVSIPKGVETKINAGMLNVKGPKGQLEYGIHPQVKVQQEGDHLTFAAGDESTFADAMSETDGLPAHSILLSDNLDAAQ